MRNPFRQDLPGPTGRLNADRVKARGHVEILELGRFAQMVAVVRGEAFGPVEKEFDPRGLQRRQTVHGLVEHILKMVPVFTKSTKRKVFGNGLASPSPRLGLEFKETRQDTADFFLEVRCTPRVA